MDRKKTGNIIPRESSPAHHDCSLQTIFQLKSYMSSFRLKWHSAKAESYPFDFRSSLQNRRKFAHSFTGFLIPFARKVKFKRRKNVFVWIVLSRSIWWTIFGIVSNKRSRYSFPFLRTQKSQENVVIRNNCIFEQLKKSWIVLHRGWHIFNGYIAYGQKSEGSAPHVHTIKQENIHTKLWKR